jgi:Protein of unknown function (DUF1214)
LARHAAGRGARVPDADRRRMDHRANPDQRARRYRRGGRVPAAAERGAAQRLWQAIRPAGDTDLHTDWPKDQEVAAYIHHLTPRQYWDLYYCSLSHNQSRPEDKDLLAQLSTAGWAADKKLDLGALSESDRSMWQNGWTKALSKIEVDLGVQQVNGWQISRTDIGSYGSNYSARAAVAHGVLGANLPEDPIYPATRVEANNGPLQSDRAYVLHLGKEQIPPVHAFWSLTKYNEKGFFVANPINRYAVRASVAEEPRRLGRHLHPATRRIPVNVATPRLCGGCGDLPPGGEAVGHHLSVLVRGAEGAVGAAGPSDQDR